VIPLAVYLLTFIMAFSRRLRLPTRAISPTATAALLAVFPLAAVDFPIHSGSVWTLMACHLLILFLGGLLCHSALADSRPSTTFLTEFYFLIALGGVLGGMFVSIVAPVIFSTIFEYPLLIGTIMFFRVSHHRAAVGWRDIVQVAGYAFLVDGTIRLLKWMDVDAAYFTLSWHWSEISRDDMVVAITGAALILTLLAFRKKPVPFALAFAALVTTLAVEVPRQYQTTTVVHIDRNFFGVKKVLFNAGDNTRQLLHGDTVHGLESLDPAQSGEPLFYYHRGGALSDIISLLDRSSKSTVAVVGLGAGTIAAYATPMRHITFIDIDPQMVDIARTYFTFLGRCSSNCEVVVGDGRLSIEARHGTKYDLIVLDAFNSDAVPAHLISREAVRMYVSKLQLRGVLLFHVSNRYLDVGRLAASVAIDEGLHAYARPDDDYIAAVRTSDDLSAIPNREKWIELARPPNLRSWTDDYSNVVSLIRWKR
jgi:spermidine synthase